MLLPSSASIISLITFGIFELLVAAFEGNDFAVYHADHLGGTNVITTDTGVKRELVEYTPFGSIAKKELYGSNPQVAEYYFTGKPLDDETGLYYYGARYYDPTLGRFLTADTLVPYPGNPQVFNRYSYAHNNPVNLVDPTGHFAWFIPLVVGAIKGAIVGAAVGAAFSAITGGNVGQGALLGAIGGAFFGGTSGIIGHLGTKGITLSKGLSILAYAEAGAYAGAVSAAVTGDEVWRGAVVGGFSAGFSKFVGANFDFLKIEGNDSLAFIGNNLREAIVGGAAGGITAEFAGGSFKDGFQRGAFSAAVGYTTGQWIFDKGLKSFYKIATAPLRGLNLFKINELSKAAFANEGPLGEQEAHQGQAVAYSEYVGDRVVAGTLRIIGEVGQEFWYGGKTLASLAVGNNVPPSRNPFTLYYQKDSLNDIYVTFTGKTNDFPNPE